MAPMSEPVSLEEEPASPAKDAWATMRKATSARVGLGRSGDAMPLSAVLEFQHAHAKARDAVHSPLDEGAIEDALKPLTVVHVESSAPDRATYLRRPDLGRRLSEQASPDLDAVEKGCDVAFVIADGLSAFAVQTHAAPLVHACMKRMAHLNVAPVVVARQARVALGDDVGERLQAKIVAVFIGERPGLSVAESLGVYLTYAPKRGRRDSERNCVSNIHRLGGLSYDLAADKLAWLVNAATKLQLTGVALKDEMAAIAGGEATKEIG
jgi:ethanolamine ammonia-lyase small subunit